MDIHAIRQQMRTTSIYDIPIRVTFYARVSSEKDEQLNSLDNQIGYYRNYNGNKIAHSTMSGMIANPKYKGYYVGNKVKVVDMFTKKQKFLPPEEWVMFNDETGEIVPAIVSEELWEEANQVLARRSSDVKKRQNQCNHGNLLTGKLFCTHCGRAYYRRDSKDKDGNINSKWVCSGKINNGADSCPSFAIYESEIKPILFDVFNETSSAAEDLIEQYIAMYQSLDETDETAKEIAALQKKIELETKKKAKLLEYNMVPAGKQDRSIQPTSNSAPFHSPAPAKLGIYGKHHILQHLMINTCQPHPLCLFYILRQISIYYCPNLRRKKFFVQKIFIARNCLHLYIKYDIVVLGYFYPKIETFQQRKIGVIAC